ncbi:MAG: hypothetical protein FWE10_00180 [Rikenellaceae bacterium]|nr:hypothetical protein [Rikenellaceae bacterium]MCL2692157.1 hypothetical protein [Rikenellaceae bacterium]
MKNHIICLSALMLLSSMAYAQIPDDVGRRAEPVEINREQPRMRTVSYASQDEAIAGDRSEQSRYFRPIAEWARTTDGAGNAVYTGIFRVPFAWLERQHFLHIGAATSSYVVRVNGTEAGYNQSGRTAAEFDVTAASQEGPNTVEITVLRDPASAILQSAQTPPAITGETYVVSQPRIRIRDYTARANLAGDITSLELGVIVKSHLLNPKSVRVYYALFDPDGRPGPYGHRDADFEMKLEDTVRFFVNIPDPRPWSHESPSTYTLALRLQHEGRFTEYVAYNIGLRTVDVRDGELFINNRPVPIHMADYSFGGSVAEAERELRALKQSGINTIKVRGSPQPEAFYALCDRLGLYVCNQADIDTRAHGESRAVGGNPSNDPQWAAAFVDRAVTMYRTSKNHPSVVMFSLAENSANGYNLYESYFAIRELEHYRPVVYLDGEAEWNSDALRAALHARAPVGLERRVRIETTPATDAVSGAAPTISTGPREGTFIIHNNNLTAPLRAATLIWTVRQGRRVVERGETVVAESIRAGESATATVTYGKAKRGTPLTVELTVYRPREAFDPAPIAFGGRRNRNALPAHLIRLTEQTFNIPF